MKKAFIVGCSALGIALLSLMSACGPRLPKMGSAELSAAGPRKVEGGVQFTLFVPKAHKVNIVGDFNNWSTSADPMYDRTEKGEWSITLPLKPGRYEYKFLLDGEKWMSDPGNSKKVKDGFGAFNSVAEVGP